MTGASVNRFCIRSHAVKFSLSSINIIATSPVYSVSPSVVSCGCPIFLLMSFRSPDRKSSPHVWPTSSVAVDQKSEAFRINSLTCSSVASSPPLLFSRCILRTVSFRLSSSSAVSVVSFVVVSVSFDDDDAVCDSSSFFSEVVLKLRVVAKGDRAEVLC